MTLRAAVPSDVPVLLELIHDLAIYEKEPDAVKTTAEMLHAALFAPNPQVYATMAEDEHGVQGCAIWFLSFSTWEGVHGIYLEDLYVRPEARGRGHGKALLLHLAQLALQRGYARVEWSVLKWNTPSIGFYRSLGAHSQDEWTTFRLDGPALAEAAANS
ncbi:GNAT family N-acetyltransferase [Psychromicrobium xiongbiense]|uniref:GNAT family N-acetyltransferase n=1 Tax=Psychromicrobium xiongbiense TaxID=3051184 RepID=UPI0025578089|nr:GNAT family N-acetyltransferase [Psychromicrobium sp. YIM S02556]